MADGDITLVSATGDAIDLNPLLTSNNGVQVVAGLTGFGLPSVEVMYQVGAGDGAKYRGTRALPRDIDLPLHIVGTSRANLRSHVNRLVRALSGECRLRWDDGDRVWETKVRRVGGGEYVMGTDTALLELNLTITLRAESPMWTATSSTTTSKTFGTSDATQQVIVPTTAFGTSDSRPLLKVHGPTLGFKVENHDKSKSFQYLDFITSGTYVLVDTATGRVTDANGTNKYGRLSAAPQFFALTADANSVYVTVDRSTGQYLTTSQSVVAKNRFTNPTFNTSSTGWTFSNPLYGTKQSPASNLAYDSVSKSIKFKEFSDLNMGGRVWHTMQASVAASNFTPGTRYQVEIHLGYMPAYNGSGTPAQVAVYSNGARLAQANPITEDGKVLMRADFIAPDTEVQISVVAPHEYGGYPNQPAPRTQKPMEVTHVSLTEYGFGYFDGDTTDTSSAIYNWSGTAHASISTYGIPAQDKNLTKVEVTTTAMNWMVV